MTPLTLSLSPVGRAEKGGRFVKHFLRISMSYHARPNKIFTAEPPRTPRIYFLFGGEIPPNKSLSL